MKKSISILAIPLMFASGTEAKERENSWTELNLKGRVKSMREIRFAVVEKSEQLQKGERKDSIIYIFSDKGNKIEKNSYNPDGSIKAKYTYRTMTKI